jgi:RNA polymerase sigma-70 factor (ECF subfamily)
VADSELATDASAGAAPDAGASLAQAIASDAPAQARQGGNGNGNGNGAAPSRSRRARAERATAVAQLMDAHSDAVFGFCMRMMRVRAVAEDVAQQVLLEACRDLDRFEGRSPPRTWLLGIANHRCLDALKSLDRRSKHVESNEQAMLAYEDPGTSPIEYIARAQLTAALEQCLASLSPDVRATVLLRFHSGATYHDLADSLEATADALQARVSRALPALRRCLEGKGWTGE